MKPEKAGPYRSYLLRCWREKSTHPDKPAVWRFRLQEVSEARDQYAFGSFEQLMDFLRNELMGDHERKR